LEREAIATSLEEVRSGIRAACLRVGRDPSEVTLVAVTKTVPADVVRLAAGLGVSDFGENYAKELAAKASLVPATWHFVGKVQRGTAAAVASHADVVHSAVPGPGIAAVASRAARADKRMRLFVQVDYTGRRQGVDPDEVGTFIGEMHSTAGVRVLGLMTLPPVADSPEATRPYFARLRDLRDRLRKEWPEVRELSMGMSLDYEVAVEEGATMVRVGTALFGRRPVGTG
jgi:pyridoxal phosphate enzyme (YggS family)